MRKRAFSKNLMLIAGILAAIIILFSQAFQKETDQILSKIKPANSGVITEKPAEAEKKVIISTPADAVISGTAVQVADANPSLIREIIFDENSAPAKPVFFKTLFVDLFKTLFKAVISPQAP